MNPSLGDIVIFHPAGSTDSSSDCAAVITKVWSAGTVNLTVFEQDGTTTARTSVVQRDPMRNGNSPEHGYLWSKRGAA